MTYEGKTSSTSAGQLYTVGSPYIYTEDDISITNLSLLIDPFFSNGSGLYDIGTGSVGHSNPNSTSIISHSSGTIFAGGLTFFTVQPNAQHASDLVNIDIAGDIFDISTPTGLGTSVFFGFISDTAVSSFDMTTSSARYLQTDNIMVVTSAIPEPSVLALFGLGFAGLGFSARRRKAI